MPLEQYLRAYWRDIAMYLHYMLKVTYMATHMHLQAPIEERGREEIDLTHPIYHGVPL